MEKKEVEECMSFINFLLFQVTKVFGKVNLGKISDLPQEYDENCVRSMLKIHEKIENECENWEKRHSQSPADDKSLRFLDWIYQETDHITKEYSSIFFVCRTTYHYKPKHYYWSCCNSRKKFHDPGKHRNELKIVEQKIPGCKDKKNQ